MKNVGKADISVSVGKMPCWPATNAIYWSIVESHNQLVDESRCASILLSGSQSITLVMVCAALNKTIPLKYRLDTKRAKGITGHAAYVKEYLLSARAGTFVSGKGKGLCGPNKLFTKDLGVSVSSVNEGLERAFKLAGIW